MIVNEAGASVYSASKLATEEFPGFDVGQRSAVSIARRLQGPAGRAGEDRPQVHRCRPVPARSEPEAPGRGAGLCGGGFVNRVGVDLNTASVSLLEHISGISITIAKISWPTGRKTGPLLIGSSF